LATAPQALNGGPVAAATRTRVAEAAAVLRYVPRADRQAQSPEVKEIALRILPTPDTLEGYSGAFFFYPLIRGALAGAEQGNFHLSLRFVDLPAVQAGEHLAREAAASTSAPSSSFHCGLTSSATCSLSGLRAPPWSL
jgi:DNA-binding LacI/PurR family transcriptional regulator